MLYEHGEHGQRRAWARTTQPNGCFALTYFSDREILARAIFWFGSWPGALVPRRGFRPWGAAMLQGIRRLNLLRTAAGHSKSSPPPSMQTLGCLRGFMRGACRVSTSIPV